MDTQQLKSLIREESVSFHPVVAFDRAADHLLLMDFTSGNSTVWTEEIIQDEELFTTTVMKLLQQNEALYGIGGYDELRTVYARSEVFSGLEPRRLHLGIDIWGAVGTEISAPMDAIVHSVAFNDHYGDYGATIILQHTIRGQNFYTLYGHLALNDIADLQEGTVIRGGQSFAHFGNVQENGHWPPHLHFQVVIDMEGKQGDYPGVCALSERNKYLSNCPDPDIILNMMQYACKK